MPQRILHVASEVAPYSQTGGLGDVLGSLPAAQRAAGADVQVITPLYGCIPTDGLREVGLRPVRLGGASYTARLLTTPDDSVLFVDIPGLLDRPRPYGDPTPYPDNPLRFAVLCRVAADLCEDVALYHLHDWQAALTALYLAGRRPTLLTIHNLAYQGLFGFEWADRLAIPSALRNYEGVEFYGRLSLLKSGLVLAERLATVSPTYAHEIQSEPGGLGLAGLFAHRRGGLTGILNGIDTVDWDPASDPALPAHFDAEDRAPRATCTAALRDAHGLSAGPIAGLVARAVEQKGLDLLTAAAPVAIEGGLRFVCLADGDPDVVAGLRELAAAHPHAFALIERFEPNTARRIYAGADFILVPSRYEPCGLTQLYGMRYGAVPVVRRTGGLADTVEDGVTGLSFSDATPEALASALLRARALAEDLAALDAIRAEAMRRDWSWTRPAQAYLETYERMTSRRGGL